MNTRPGSGGVAEWAGRLSPTSRIAIAAVRAVIFGVLAVVVTVLLLSQLGAAGSAGGGATGGSEQAAAVEAATVKVPQTLSYDHRTVEQDLGRAEANTTGAFQRQFVEVVRSTVVPTARAEGIVSTATVVGTAVVSADDREVVMLMFINQSTTSAASPEPRLAANRTRVTMTSVDGQWLISDLRVL